MKYLTQAEIAFARELPALDYFQRYEPYELTRNGSTEFRLKSNHSVSLSSESSKGWYDHATGEGGHSALDFLIKSRGLPFMEAAERLSGSAAERSRSPPACEVSEPETKVFTLPQQNITDGKPDNRRVFAYLRGRGIDAEIINHHIKRGALYEESSAHYNAVFVGFADDGVPRYAGLHGTNSYRRFVGETGGSDKRFPFCEISDSSGKLFVFESAIDLMSAQTLMKLKHGDCRGASVMSLGGVALNRGGLPVSLEHVLSKHTGIQRVILALDNDEVGLNATERLTSLLSERGYEVSVRPVRYGKDINDELRMTLNAKARKRTESTR